MAFSRITNMRVVSSARETRAVSQDYSVSTEDGIIGVRVGGITVTLPSSASVDNGFVLVIKDETGAGSGNSITIAASGNDTIDGSGTVSMDDNYSSVSVYRGQDLNWYIY